MKKGAVKKVTVTGTSKTLSKLSKGKTYYVKVRALRKIPQAQRFMEVSAV